MQKEKRSTKILMKKTQLVVMEKNEIETGEKSKIEKLPGIFEILGF